MKINQSIVYAITFLLFSSGAYNASLTKENFFVKVLSQPNEIDGPAILSAWDFSDPVFNWLQENSSKIYFGEIIPKDIPATYSDEKKASIKNNIAQMLNLVGRASQEYSLNALLALIDKKIESIDFNDAINAAKAFRHLQNTVANCNHPLGDFICYYILTSKITISIDADVNIPKLWLSDAYYELSQVYSHLISYRNKNWKSDGKLYLFGELTDNKQRLYPGRKLGSPLDGVSYRQMSIMKLMLLQHSLLNNPANHLSWVRAIEFAIVDIPEAEQNKFIIGASLPLSFDLTDAKIEEIVAMKFEEIERDANNSFLPEKISIIKKRFLPILLKMLEKNLQAIKNKRAEIKNENVAKKQKTSSTSSETSSDDKENQSISSNMPPLVIRVTE